MRSQEAYDRIRRMIFDHELAPNSHVGEVQLANLLSMSRTPVREAMARLESEGLLMPAAHRARGYTIAGLSPQDLFDTYVVRATLEGLAAAEAARHVTRVDLARLEDLYDAMEEARDKGDDARLAQLNSQFHAGIARASGNRCLQSMLDEIRGVFERFRNVALMVPGRRDAAHDEHSQIIEALRLHDPNLARQVAEQHVQRALEARRSVLAAARDDQAQQYDDHRAQPYGDVSSGLA